MPKLLKVLIVLCVIMITGICSLLLFVFWKSTSRINTKYEITLSSIPVPKSALEIAEGKRIYISRGCSDCHGKDLSGLTFISDPAIGTFSGSNLTTGKGGLSPELTATHFDRAVRHGIGANGRALLFMPATDFQKMTDEDLGRIIAYIQSVPPVDKPSVPIEVGPLGRFLFTIGKLPHLVTAELVDHTLKSNAKLAPEVSLDYGKYIATTCTGCHGDNLVGGPIPGAPPEWPLAQDITAKGIGKWSESEFISAIRTGKRPNGSEIRPPMPWQNFALMTDTELKSLRIYLISL